MKKPQTKVATSQEKSSPTKDCDLNSSIKLDHPKVPKNEYIDVYVVETRDPTNFVVQMLREKAVDLKVTIKFFKNYYNLL